MITALYQSPIGCVEVISGANGIRAVRLLQGRDCYGGNIPSELSEAVFQLDEYFHRKRKIFDLELDLSDGPPFHQAVWQELRRIPYGQTTTYKAIAQKLGNPDAMRAVGLASRHNPIAFIIPCHRVIAKTGDLQGYFYGLEIKRKLLELENPFSFGSQTSLF